MHTRYPLFIHFDSKIAKIKQASHLSMSNFCDTDQTAHRQAHNHKI